MSKTLLLTVGFVVHVVFLCALIDIYFRTPIITGISPEKNPVPGPAKRTVLFIADGLRADSLYPFTQKSTPFIRGIIEKQGTWGVSHTRVPTESRTGTVAVIAGVYEDPSAIFKGWKEYPVEFDTVLNQSRHAWAWGSPDIVDMFSKDHVETYSEEGTDYSSTESWKTDLWVFRTVETFFKNAKNNVSRKELLQQDQIIFLLHLIGLDIAGHSVKPTSKHYQENLKVVDSGIKKIVDIIESFYNHDGRTAYILTADHGMTDWGSHGAGSRDETEVPIVAWGAGIFKPRPTEVLKHGSPGVWHLGHLVRVDIHQADTAVLIAALTGCNIPVNSMGWIPIQYINVSSKDIASLAFYNARQLMNQAKRKREMVHAGTLSWLYKPFPEMPPEREDKLTADINYYFNLGDYNGVAWQSKELADLSVRALHYYHNYYRDALLLATSLGFLSWIAWLLHAIYVVPQSARNTRRPWKQRYITIPFGTIAIILVALIQVQNLPLQYNVYALLPVLLLWTFFRQGHLWLPVLLGSNAWGLIITFIFVVAFSIVMVSAFFHRWMLSLWLLALGLWPTLDSRLRQTVTSNLKLTWVFCSVLLAIFPLLPVVGGEPSVVQVLLSGLLWLAVGAVAGPGLDTNRCLNTVQLAVLFAAVINNVGVTSCMALGMGLPFLCKAMSWSLFGVSLVLPLLSETTIPSRLLSLMLGVVVPYILLSVKHEGLFLVALSAHLVLWLLLEAHTSQSRTTEAHTVVYTRPSKPEKALRMFSQEDFRRAVFFVFYIFLSFFGTGNIASINSFDVTWVRCFLTTFLPFLITALVLFKTLVPFLIVTAVFRAISILVQAPTEGIFIAVLVVCDLMGLQFLHLVTNEGSWLDIGSSISHYVIVQVTVLLLFVIYGVIAVFTGIRISVFKRDIERKDHPEKETYSAKLVVGQARPRRGFQGLLPS